MNKEIIDSFVKATVHVLETIAQTVPEQGEPLLHEDRSLWGDVTGFIAMSGEGVEGTMVVSFDEKCILDIVSKMLFEEFTELTAEIVDAVGEITNMICGGAKVGLGEQGLAITMARPMMITGKEFNFTQHKHADHITIPFSTAAGRFVIEASIKSTKL